MSFHVSQHKPGLLAVRLDAGFCWRHPASGEWQVDDLRGVVFVVPDAGLPEVDVVDGIKARLFEQYLALYGVQEFEWIEGGCMV